MASPWVSVLCQLVGQKSASIAMHWFFFAGQERWKICFEGVGIALLCNQWMLMCTSANHYNILQIQDCLGYPADSPRNCNGLLVLELRYFGQHKNLTIYFTGSYEKGKSPGEHEKAQSGGPGCCHVSV